MMQLSFAADHAEEYGVNEAIMIRSFQYWIGKNAANGTNARENSTWTYNTFPGLVELFPFWSIDQIKRIIKSLLDKRLIKKGSFNKQGYDRTNWYAFEDEKKFLPENLINKHSAKSPDEENEHNANPHDESQQHSAISLNPSSDIARPIPIKDTNRTYINKKKNKQKDKKDWEELYPEYVYMKDQDNKKPFVDSGSGTRITEDWILCEEWGSWALEQGITHEEVVKQAGLFKDYYTSEDAAKPVKRNWRTAWKLWIKRFL